MAGAAVLEEAPQHDEVPASSTKLSPKLKKEVAFQHSKLKMCQAEALVMGHLQDEELPADIVAFAMDVEHKQEQNDRKAARAKARRTLVAPPGKLSAAALIHEGILRPLFRPAGLPWTLSRAFAERRSPCCAICGFI